MQRLLMQCIMFCLLPLQVGTQRSWKRPYGVGLIVAGYDESGEQEFVYEWKLLIHVGSMSGPHCDRL